MMSNHTPEKLARDIEKAEYAPRRDSEDGDQISISSHSSGHISSRDELEAHEKETGHDLSRVNSHRSVTSNARSVASKALSRTLSRITTRDIVDPGPAPDGGFKAWLQVFFAFIVAFTTWGYINSFGAFQTYYTGTLGVSQSTVSWIGSVNLFIVFGCSAFSGRALDAGFFTPCLAIGSAVQILGIFMTSLSKNVWQLILAQGVCTAIGSGIIFCPTMGLISTYFLRKRALAIAIVSSGNSAGGCIYPVIVRELLPRIGFAWTIRVLGFFNLACLAAALAFLHPRLPPRKSGPIVEWRAFKEAPFVFMVTGMSFVFGGLFFSYYYIGSYGRNIIGMPYIESTNLLIIFNGIGIPVRLFTGFIVDKYVGPLNGMIPLLFINGIFAFAWIAVKNRVGLYVFAVFYGMSAGAFQCLFPTTAISLNDDLSKNGVRLGMAFSIFGLAGLVGPPIGGALLQTNGGGRGGYLAAQLGLGLATLLGSCLMVAARVKKEGWSLWIKC